MKNISLENPDTLRLPHPYTHLTQIEDLNIIQHLFNNGRCHIYALALSNNNSDLQMYAIYRNDEIQHIYCMDSEGKIFDSTGTYTTLKEYQEADSLHRFLLVEHTTISSEEINQLIEANILMPTSSTSFEMANLLAEHLNQI